MHRRLPSCQLTLRTDLRTFFAVLLFWLLGIFFPLPAMPQLLLPPQECLLILLRPNSSTHVLKYIFCEDFPKPSPLDRIVPSLLCPIPVPWSLASLLQHAGLQLLVAPFNWMALEGGHSFVLFVCTTSIRVLDREQLSGCPRSE